MEKPIVIMNFTNVYKEEAFARHSPDFAWIDCTHLSGTDCYCDAEGAAAIRRLIAAYPPEGIHFIDSGDYHYLTKFWTDKITEPFSLIVFDEAELDSLANQQLLALFRGYCKKFVSLPPK